MAGIWIPPVASCIIPAVEGGVDAGEYSLLLALAQNARRVLSREQLLEPTRSDSVEVFDRTIDVLIMGCGENREQPAPANVDQTLRGLG